MRSLGLVCIVSILAGCGGYRVSGSTVTFEACSENGCKTTTMADADPKSFETLQGEYAKDRHHAYLSGVVIPQADAQSFQALTASYAKDDSRVYYQRTPIAGADSGTFAVLADTSYGRDKHDIYASGSAVGACHLASFTLLKEDWAVDRQCAYRGGHRLPNAQPDSFTVINEEYAKDAAHVYSAHTDKAVEGVDIATFRAERMCMCGRDKNRCYDGALPTSCGLH
jgi:hypothetical protein